jgi:DNA-binding transcriptional ArsR family regulator
MQAQRHAAMRSALGDFHRILILYALAENPTNVTELASRLSLSQPTVSRHLRLLRECGIVASERQGKSVYYELADPRILQALDLLRAMIADQITKQAKANNTPAHRPAL